MEHAAMPVPGSADSCAQCGSHAAERLYARLAEGRTCEHCLLERRKAAVCVGEEAYERLVEALAAALDLREHATGLHSKRVACHTLVLARHFYSDPGILRQIYWGSLLHDIGKIGVPDAILLKPGKLDTREWAIMHLHPGMGAEIIGKHDNELLETARIIALTHHEKWDGSGYPQRLAGADIPLPGRIVAIADVFDALVSTRPYKPAMSVPTALEYMESATGSHFDPQLMAAFQSTLLEILRIREIYADEHGALGDIDFRIKEIFGH